MARRSRRSPVVVAVLRSHIAVLGAILATLVAGCADDERPARRPAPAPAVALTAEDRAVWRAPATDPGRIPVLLYHGIAERSAFAGQADEFYAVRPAEFAKQMALLDHAGYTAITLEQFRDFHAGRPVDLPAHPILITFDDGRADAWLHADPVLARHGWSAVHVRRRGRGERRGTRSTRAGTSWPRCSAAAAGRSSCTPAAATTASATGPGSARSGRSTPIATRWEARRSTAGASA
jgi:hypothetical protein